MNHQKFLSFAFLEIYSHVFFFVPSFLQIKASVQSDGGIQTEQRLEVETRLFFTVITRRKVNKIEEDLTMFFSFKQDTRESQR